MTAYFIITLIVTGVVSTMHYRLFSKEKKSEADHKEMAAEYQNLKMALQAMRSLSSGGTDQDQIPGGTGEFGYELSNPIPVHTIWGCTDYLDRLKTNDNRNLSYQRIGSFHSPVSDSPVDGYQVSISATETVVLYFSIYQRCNSERTPRNFQW